MAYTAKTAEEIQAQAATEYQSYYDQLKLAAQQQTDTQDLLYQQQKSGLGTTYGNQITASQKEYASTYSQAGRETLSRGMQRSTYNNQTLANVNTKAAEAKQTIYDAQAAAESNIEGQRTSLASQLAAQIMQYDASQAADIQKRIAEIGNEEYQKSQDAIANELAQAQLNEEIRQFNVTQSNKKSSGGSSKAAATVATPATGSSVFTTAQLTALLSKGTTTPAKTTTTTTKSLAADIKKAGSVTSFARSNLFGV